MHKTELVLRLYAGFVMFPNQCCAVVMATCMYLWYVAELGICVRGVVTCGTASAFQGRFEGLNC